MAQQAIPYGAIPNDPNTANDIDIREAFKRTHENFTDLFSRQSRTISAGEERFSSQPTPEARINAAIAQAIVELASAVSVPAFMLPYNVDQVTFNDTVKMVREGGISAGGVWDAAAYGGKISTLSYTEHGYTIREAVKACAANGGGTVDCQGFPGNATIVLAVDTCSLLNEWETAPITFVWGGHEVRIKTRQKPKSHHHHHCFGTTFILKDENGARVTGSVFPFYTNAADAIPSGGVISTSGSNVLTMATPSDPLWAKLEIGSPLLVNGFVPPVGVDKTTINVVGGIDAVTATITVASTTAFATASDLGWPQGGRIRIENEIISYTSKDATHFLGCTRGAEGTTAATHADTTRVDRVSYQPFVVTAISGSAITLDLPMNITANNLAVQIGHFDISFDGVADFDGNKNPTADDTSNPMGLWINGTRKLYVGPSLTFHHWDHGGWSLSQCQDCVAFGRGAYNGYFPASLGVGFWCFGWNKRLTVDILEVDHCTTGLYVDDRSVLPQIVDGPCEDSSFRVRRATQMGTVAAGPGNGMIINGARNCTATVERAQFIAGLGGCSAISFGDAAQWGDGTTVTASGNILEVGVGESPDGTYLAINSQSVGGNGVNTMIVKQRVTVSNFQPKNVAITAPCMFDVTYGTTVNTNAGRTEFWKLNVTDGVAFTIANPTNLTDGRHVEYYIANSSGTTMGAVTFDSKFKLAGAFVAPATGQARVYRFCYHLSNDKLVEEFRSAADQAI